MTPTDAKIVDFNSDLFLEVDQSLKPLFSLFSKFLPISQFYRPPLFAFLASRADEVGHEIVELSQHECGVTIRNDPVRYRENVSFLAVGGVRRLRSPSGNDPPPGGQPFGQFCAGEKNAKPQEHVIGMFWHRSYARCVVQ